MLIAIGHEKQVGKDKFIEYCVEYLLHNHCNEVEVFSLANIIKYAVYELYKRSGVLHPQTYNLPINREKNLKEQIIPELNKSTKQLWNDLSNILQEYDPEIAERPLKQAVRRGGIVFINDFRYKRHIPKFKELGAMFVKVKNDRAVKAESGPDRELDDFQDWDLIIDNSFSLEKLASEATQFCDKYILRRTLDANLANSVVYT